MQDELIAALPIALLFTAILWIMVFIETYMHFPKMDPKQRLGMSLFNASVLSVFLLVFVFIALYLVLRYMLKI